MLIPAGPMSNAERQRRFQAAHPGYDRRRKARRRAALKRSSKKGMDEHLAVLRAEQATMASDAPALPAPAPAPPAPHRVLTLPAPADQIVVPGLNAIARPPAATAERQLLLFPAMRPAA
jgi:hypothetical protein